MRRVFLHTGFHKTGTTSAQSFLQANRKLIWPHNALLLPNRVEDIKRAATFHSQSLDPLSLSEFRYRWGELLKSLDLGEKRGIVLSSEDFCGLRPTRDGDEGYTAAPVLMEAMVEGIRKVIGPQTEITVYMSVRDPYAWVRSQWTHQLQAVRLKDDHTKFASYMRQHSDLRSVVEKVRERVGSKMVVAHSLEALSQLEFGPATPFLDFLNLRPAQRAKLVASGHHRKSPTPAQCAELLALNRSDLDDEQLAKVKADLLTPPTTRN